MSVTGDHFSSDADMVQIVRDEDVDFVAPTSELNDPSRDSDLTLVPSAPDLVERIDDAGFVSGEDRVVNASSDGYVISGDIAGEDVVDFGMSSDASLGGLGTNIDDLPGDETPVSRENIRTEI